MNFRCNTLLFLAVVVLALTTVTSASRRDHAHRNSRGGPSVIRAGRVEEHQVKYQNFDEYLLSIGVGESRSHNQVTKETATQPPHHHGRRPPPTPHTSDDEDMVAGSGHNGDDNDDDTPEVHVITPTPPPVANNQGQDERHPDPPSPAYDLDILGYFRDVPREHWSCCMLGKLAGDKGFHCYAGFYAARIQARNLNRAHNKKMHFHGSDAIPNWGTGLMHTFQRCVATHGDEFHKCCYAATIEKRERVKWSRYATQGQQNQEQQPQEQQQHQQHQQHQQQTQRQGRQHQQHSQQRSNRPGHQQ